MTDKTVKMDGDTPNDEEILLFLKQFGRKPDEKITHLERESTWIYFTRWRYWVNVDTIDTVDGKKVLLHLIVDANNKKNRGK